MIKTEGLGKKYRLRNPKVSFWALQDINLEIGPGEAVGLIGENGSGKSTLLKLLARVTVPTQGQIFLSGRVGALLEVGTGFHAELTGRENIFLSGAILGMHRKEVKRHFDEIIDFAGAGPFLDTPVKKYSSGMFLRLAFSVMAHLTSEILLIDEALSVGDVPFQEKALDKMRALVNEGRTIILVSHQMQMIDSFCSRLIHLHEGRCHDCLQPQET
ncbi:MAG: ABC transporter ATP-binding protein [Simkaniaceae bacterium]|nr:ABC transporter ATP-binding protein [Candidatus Sacchlamyda saccharinae]